MGDAPQPFSLDQIRIASPCPMKWSDMAGDDTTRFCSRCSLHVHNLSSMTRADAEAFLTERAGERVCAMFFKRSDGTVITRDCPVGVAEGKRRRMRIAAAIGAAFTVITGSVASWWARGAVPGDGTITRVMPRLEPFRAIRATLLAPNPPAGTTMLLGDCDLPNPNRTNQLIQLVTAGTTATPHPDPNATAPSGADTSTDTDTSPNK